MVKYENLREKCMNGIDKQTYLYKYIKLKYLKPLIKNKKLRIDTISKWGDPYENFFLKSKFFTDADFYKEEVKVNRESIINHTYGQSWTLIEESDAMWSIYSNKEDIDETAIRIKIEADKLFKIIYTEDWCMATTSMHIVEYKTDDELTQWNKNLTNINRNFPEYIKESLHIKRKAFEHEKEVRIIISTDSQSKESKFLEFNIPNLDIIEEFILDPRLKEENVEEITQQLCKLGVDKNKIKTSKLYDFTPINLTI